MAPVNGFRVVAEVVIGQSLQLCQFGDDGSIAGEVGVEV